ncbi:hypothetical protein NQ315_014078 [Exocentrus adspersus]|uniref:DDE-1 domain-containing protein n=1 Tax=Exocentrus adspersus TaxID=1586481 RepID=A0AAV8VVN7_9CUCU|nr:hypothetical protein NQ315_014078 [Exocentrus adspersus]
MDFQSQFFEKSNKTEKFLKPPTEDEDDVTIDMLCGQPNIKKHIGELMSKNIFLRECYNLFQNGKILNWKGEVVTKIVKRVNGWKITINGIMHLWDVLESHGMQSGVGYSKEHLTNAVSDVINKNKTYREAEEHYHTPISVIYHRIKGRNVPIDSTGPGRKTSLSPEVEVIVNCLIARARIGFPCDRKELCELVGEYVKSKNIVTCFKDGVPGTDWYLGFMKRHDNIPLKKPEHLQYARKNARDPFIAYAFYDKLNTTMVTHNLNDDSKRPFIFIADESRFNSDPSRLRAIGEKGKPLSRVSRGSGRESTTVLACISSDGFSLPPFIMYKEAAVQAKWTSEHCFPDTMYGASKNGWMEEPHFFNWFLKMFIPHVNNLRTSRNLPDQAAILLFDGHCSHISVRIVEEALKSNIQLLVKFPSHLTDRIQPLDKCVFGPLKTIWDKLLVNYGKLQMDKTCVHLTREKFAELLGEAWSKGMTKENIISGFQTTGIFPVDPKKFSEDNFSPGALKRYREKQLEQQHLVKQQSETPVFSQEQRPSSINILQDITLRAKIFNQKITHGSPSEISKGLEEKSTRLKQARYGEVLTTPEILLKLKAEEKKRGKAIKTIKRKQRRIARYSNEDIYNLIKCLNIRNEDVNLAKDLYFELYSLKYSLLDRKRTVFVQINLIRLTVQSYHYERAFKRGGLSSTEDNYRRPSKRENPPPIRPGVVRGETGRGASRKKKEPGEPCHWRPTEFGLQFFSFSYFVVGMEV